MADDDLVASIKALDAISAALADLIGQKLGYGPLPATMPPGLLEQVNDEVERALANWRLAEERDTRLRPTSTLQHLFAEHCRLERKIRDLRSRPSGQS